MMKNTSDKIKVTLDSIRDVREYKLPIELSRSSSYIPFEIIRITLPKEHTTKLNDFNYLSLVHVGPSGLFAGRFSEKNPQVLSYIPSSQGVVDYSVILTHAKSGQMYTTTSSKTQAPHLLIKGSVKADGIIVKK